MSAPFVLQSPADALIAIWEEIERELQLLSRDPTLLTSQNAVQALARTDELVRVMNRELASMRLRTLEWAQIHVQDAVQSGTVRAVLEAERQGATGLVARTGQADTHAMRIMTEEILADTDFAIDSARRTSRRGFRTTQQKLVTELALNEALLVSGARLENASQRIKRVQGLFEKRLGAGQLVNVNGRFFKLSTYAGIIANTRLAEAHTEASFRAALSMGTDLVRVSDHGSTDPICNQFAGKTFSISGKNTRFPSLRERPPFHPNCLHTLLPFLSELKSPAELDFAIARSSDRVPVGTTFEDFQRAAA